MNPPNCEPAPMNVGEAGAPPKPNGLGANGIDMGGIDMGGIEVCASAGEDALAPGEENCAIAAM